MIFNLSFLLTAVGVIYILNIFYTFWTLMRHPVCYEPELCLHYYLNKSPELHLSLYTSLKWNPRANEAIFVKRITNFQYNEPWEKAIKINIPYETARNGSLFMHIFVSKRKSDWLTLLRDKEAVHVTTPVTRYYVPNTFKKLLSNESSSKVIDKPRTHLKTVIPFLMLIGNVSMSRTKIPEDILRFIRIVNQNEFLPIISEHVILDRTTNLKSLPKDTKEANITLKYDPIGYGHLRFIMQMEASLIMFNKFGFKDKELDEIKSLVDNNLYLLMITFIVSFIHMIFDFLTFKNDIHFWRSRKSLEGLSSRAVLWRAFSQIVIFLFLLDEKASLLILVPCFIGLIIEIWKVHKVLPIDWTKLKLKSDNFTKEEIQTRKFDAESMGYLSYLLYPLCVGYAVYSFVYEPHKSIYSWAIRSAANGVYAFGFLFMLPQLFINYKLKSVAHLPWRSFMYKAFNTFIDDLFAFIIAMPTAHRIACFRDDVVFVIYMYQRWLYPVDKSRVDNQTSITEDMTPNLQKKKN